jgi:hypothetical protein
MIQSNSIASANEQLAREINEQARQDRNSPYVGKLVGIANGQCSDTWLGRALLEASADYDRLEEIWRVG